MGTPQNPDFDYIVIGSGAGGGPVAARLAEKGYTVGLIEAGKAPEQDWYDVPVFHAFASEHPDISWEFFVQHYEDEARSRLDTKYVPGKGIFYPRAGTLGGCTQHHAMITVCPHDSDWENIVSETGDTSWAPDRMRPYFQNLERCGYVDDPGEGKPNPTGHGYKGWLSTTGLDLKLGLGDPEILKTVIDASFAAWGAGTGLHLPRDPNDARTPQFEGVSFAPLSTVEGRRAGTRERIYAVREKFPQNLVLKQSHLAAKILFDDNRRAVGVECWQGQHLYCADPRADKTQTYEVTRYYCSREVILAGGAFNSPQLLMLSGIGDGERLRALDIPVVVDRPAVGKNLQDRYEISIVSEMNRNWKVLKNATFEPPPTYNDTGDPCFVDWKNKKGVYTTNGSLVSVITKSDGATVPDLYLFALAGNFRGYEPGYAKKVVRTKNYLTWAVLKAHTDNDQGYVRLKTSDPRDRPEINFNYFADENAEKDIEALIKGVKFVRQIADHNPTMKEVYPGRDKTGDKLREFIVDNAWGHHASCSNRMGRAGDPRAVVDSNFRVIGVNGLRVVDASVFPRIPGFFIVTPIYMIAEKAADVILADAKTTPAVNVA